MRARYRHLRRTIIAVMATIAFVLIVGSVLHLLGRSQPVRQWLQHRIEAEAEAHGFSLELDELEFGFVPPRLRLAGVRLAGPGVSAEIDTLLVELGELAIAKRTIVIDTIAASGVRVRADRQLQRRRQGDQPWVKLRVRQLDLHDVEVEGARLPGPLEVGVQGLTLAWVGDGPTTRGLVSVGRAVLQAKGVETIEVGLRGRFTAAETIEVPLLEIKGEGLRLLGSGRLDRDGELLFDLEAVVDLEELDRVVRAGAGLEGMCTVAATVDSRKPAVVEARVTAASLAVLGFPLERLQGKLELQSDRLDGAVERCGFLGGQLEGSYSLARLKKPHPHRVEAVATGVDLAGFLDALGVPPAGLGAQVDMDVELAWIGRAVARGQGQGVALLQATDDGLPVAGRVDAELTPEGLIRFQARDLIMGGSVMQWEGPLTIGSWEPAWSVRADPAEIAELVPVVNAWIGSPVLPLNLGGQAEIAVDIAGAFSEPHVSLRLEGHPLTFEPVELDRVVAEAVISSGGLQLNSALFRIGQGGGEISGGVSWGDDPGGGAIDLGLRAQKIPLGVVAGWIGAEGTAEGTVSISGALGGSLEEPAGRWDLDFDQATFVGEPLGPGSAEVSLAAGVFSVHGLRFESGLTGELRWLPVAAQVAGDLSWAEMPTGLLGPRVQGLLAESARVDLSFDWPLQDYPSGRLIFASDTAEGEIEADGDAIAVRAELRGALSLEANLERNADGGLDGSGAAELIAADALAQLLLPRAEVPLTGTGRASFDIQWPKDDLPRLASTVERLDLDLEGRPVRLLRPARVAVSKDGVEVDDLYLAVREDEVFARLSMGSGGELRGNVAGTLDALLLRYLIPQWEPAGRVTGVVEVLGSVVEPEFEGIAEVAQVSFLIPDTTSVFSGINGTVLLSSDEALLEGMGFRFMRGKGRCGGRIGLGDETPHLALVGRVEDLEYSLFPGFAPRLRGDFRLEGPVDGLLLSGDVTVDRAALRRNDDLVEILTEWLSLAEAGDTGTGLSLDLHVSADRSLEARSPFVRLVGSAEVGVTGNANEPGVVGQVDFLEGGEVTLQGIRYEIERFSLTFSDPLRVDPFVDIQARAWVQSYQITVRLTGTMDRLTPLLSSDPPLTEEEIMSLLALGSSGGAGGSAVGMGLASTLLSRQINAELERRAQNLLALDQVRVDPFAEASTGNPAARITVVKQLSPRWTVILQSNLSDNREEVAVSRWFIAPGLFVEATRDVDGTYAIDLKLRRRY